MLLRKLLKLDERSKEQVLTEEFQFGQQAKQLVDNPAFVRAFDSLEESLLEGLVNSEWSQYEAREVAYNRLNATKWVKNALLREIDDGKLAQKRLDK